MGGGKIGTNFRKIISKKKIVLVVDNALYHHKGIIGSLGSLEKKDLIEMIAIHDVEYIYLPYSSIERVNLTGTENNDVEQDRGDCLRIIFDLEEQKMSTSSKKPRVASLEEPKVAFITYLKDNKPQLLECKVYIFFRREGS